MFTLKQLVPFTKMLAQYWTNNPHDVLLRYTGISYSGKYLLVHMELWDDYYRAWHGDSHVAMNMETGRVEYCKSTSWLFCDDLKRSRNPEVFLFTLPIALPLKPVILLNEVALSRQEDDEGMSRYCSKILSALSSTIPDDVRSRLAKAMKATWSHDMKMRTQVDLYEAQNVLGRCALTEQHIPTSKHTQGASASGPHFQWTDNAGDCIARGTFYERRHIVRVLGSTFHNEEADILAQHYHSREVVEY